MPTETQSDKTIEDNVTKMSEGKAKNTEVMIDVMEPAEEEEETERPVLELSMKDQSQNTPTRRRTPPPLRPPKVPLLRNKKPQPEKRKIRKNTRKSFLVFHSMNSSLIRRPLEPKKVERPKPSARMPVNSKRIKSKKSMAPPNKRTNTVMVFTVRRSSPLPMRLRESLTSDSKP